MDIQKLQALAVIQEAGSFSRAAETLGYSQAGLTYMMNSLENEIGLRLLDRSYSGVRLSETGKTLMPKIHRLLQVYDALNGEINACKCAQQATLRLAALDTVSTRWVPRAVAALKSEYPQITVSVISGSPMQVDNWLRDGSVELGVTDKRFTGTEDIARAHGDHNVPLPDVLPQICGNVWQGLAVHRTGDLLRHLGGGDAGYIAGQVFGVNGGLVI